MRLQVDTRRLLKDDFRLCVGPHLTSRGDARAAERAADFLRNAVDCAGADLALPGDRQNAFAGPQLTLDSFFDRGVGSLIDLLGTIQTLEACGVDLYLDQQSIDTTTPAGRLMFQITGAFAEFERSMIRQRVRAGLKRAVEAGKQPCRECLARRKSDLLLLRHCPENCARSAVAPLTPTC
jgi:hypothetical protein